MKLVRFGRVRTYFTILILPLLTLLMADSGIASSRAVDAAPNSATDPASSLLALINQWRVNTGVWPLKVNLILQTMASAQATFLAGNLDNIDSTDESAYHRDANGRLPPERAILPPYNWPTYGSAARVEIGENAAVGSITSAMNFWQNSAIHAKAALNPAYREIGIGYAKSKSGTVFITDFGARPGVLTTVFDPVQNLLYLTYETSKYAAMDAAQTTFRLFDSDGKALSDALPWTETYTLTGSVHGTLIYVLYNSAMQQVISPVDLTGTAVVINQPDASPTAVANLPTTTSTAISVSKASPTPASPTETAEPGAPLLIIHDSQSLVLLNNSAKPIDLTGIAIASASGQIAMSNWSTIASFPVNAFPAGNCLQVRLLNSNASAPSSCRSVRSILEWPANKVFWLSGTFTVMHGTKNGPILATCQATSIECFVNLSN